MTSTVTTWLLVALGGALGSTARFGAGRLAAAATGSTFPWATFGVNVVGSFLIGVLAAALGPDGRFGAGAELRAFILVGLLGGFTTFSSFSLETLTLMRTGAWAAAGANVLGSVALCLVAVWLGHVAGSAVAR